MYAAPVMSRIARPFHAPRLIFVVGFPRSGTTWFSSLLNSHPSTVYRHEVFGRRYESFGEELFEKLKYGNGLSEEDYRAAIQTVIKSHPVTEKPPFFHKHYRRFAGPRLQKMMWMASKASRAIVPLYALLFEPELEENLVIVVKETRSSVNLGSIIKGVRADQLLILVRHPYGVIASHVEGSNAGVMPKSTAMDRRNWLQWNANSRYVTESGLTDRYVAEISEAEFVAICWRVQNEDYLELREAQRSSQTIIYESFLADSLRNTTDLFHSLHMDLNEQVIAFAKESSRPTRSTTIIKRASSNYFSVYRGKRFDPDKWKRILSREDLRLIDRHTRPLIARLGLDKMEYSQRSDENPGREPCQG